MVRHGGQRTALLRPGGRRDETRARSILQRHHGHTRGPERQHLGQHDVRYRHARQEDHELHQLHRGRRHRRQPVHRQGGVRASRRHSGVRRQPRHHDVQAGAGRQRGERAGDLRGCQGPQPPHRLRLPLRGDPEAELAAGRVQHQLCGPELQLPRAGTLLL